MKKDVFLTALAAVAVVLLFSVAFYELGKQGGALDHMLNDITKAPRIEVVQ